MNQDKSKKFSAEISRLLEIVTQSLYSHREVFIRELVSNSMDAYNKAHYLSKINNQEIDPAKILIKTSVNTIIICDNGVGMTEQELEKNLGTLAYSDTKQKSAIQPNLVGQFGLGFYSSFAVADLVEVYSKHINHNQGHIWKSNGVESYEIDLGTPFVEGFSHGTQIKIHLKENSKEFCVPETITTVVRRYMNYIPIKIYINDEKDPINFGQTLWQKKESLTAEEHKNIYQNMLGGAGEIFSYVFTKKEGKSCDYNCLTYIPLKESLFATDIAAKPLVKIYVNNIFIYDDYNILPVFLKFTRGIVDITNAAINISRESIQETGVLKAVYNFLAKEVILNLIQQREKDINDYYNKFWKHYGAIIKEGLLSDVDYRTLILETVVFYSAKYKKLISIEDYVAETKDKNILYTTNANSGQIGFHLEKEQDVLILQDQIDNIWPNMFTLYKDFTFVSINRIQESEKNEKLSPIQTKFQETLGNFVAGVQFCDNIKDNVAAFMNSAENSWDYKLARSFKLENQILPVLGLNSHHKIINILVEKWEKIDQVKAINLIYELARIEDSNIEFPKINLLEEAIICYLES